ncbi:MAG: bacterial Ig-like domain-containing protein, partial [Prevotella sp.]|nr:bacterial Ig-like domain-containing protein [Prevotella sp.]
MKKTKLLIARCLTLLVFALLSTNLAWGAEGDTHDFPQNISQLLNNNASISSITISDFNYPIKAIKIKCKYNKDIDPAVEISATVGGNTFGSTISVGNNFNGTKEIEGTSADGQIVIAFSNKTGSGTGHGTFYVTNVQLVEGAGDTPSKTLESIAISGTPKTTYETGESFDVTGLTVTGTYDDASTADLTADAEWTINPAIFTSTSQTSVSVTATVDGKSDTKNYTVTVTEHVVTPGTYEIVPNNTFFGVEVQTTGKHDPVSGQQNDITLNHSGGSSFYCNTSQTRFYTGNTLQISVPTGYNISAISFTADGSNWVTDASKISANVGTM